MKTITRILAVALAVALMVTSFAGCGKSSGDDGGEVTLKFIIPFYECKDTQLVEDEINKILPDYLPNTQLDLIMEPSMADKWSLLMSGRTAFDIAHSGFDTNLETEINKKSYMELDSLIEEYAPTIKKEMTEDYPTIYAKGQKNGKTYALANVQIHVNDRYELVIPEELKGYLNVSEFKSAAASSPTTVERIYEIIDDYLVSTKAAGKVDTDTVGDAIGITTLYDCVAKRGYDFVAGSGTSLCYKAFDKNVEIVSFYETEEFRTFIKWAKKWYDAGYISKDIMTSNSTNTGNRCAWLYAAKTTGFDLKEDGTSVFQDTAIKPKFAVCLNPDEQLYNGATILGDLSTFLSIPTTAEHPERAMQFLELTHTKEGSKILNMLAFGIEGTHYEKLSDTDIKAFDYEGQGTSKSAYSIPGWMLGNMFNMYNVYPYDSKRADYAREYYENLNSIYKTPVCGCQFVSDNVKNKLSQLMTLNTEYEKRLTCGVLEDYESVYQEFLDKAKSAGIEDVIKDYQKQADDFVKQK